VERRRIKCNVGEKQRLRKMNSLATYLFLSDHPQSPNNNKKDNKKEKGKGKGSNPRSKKRGRWRGRWRYARALRAREEEREAMRADIDRFAFPLSDNIFLSL